MGGRERLTPLPQRQQIIALVDEAVAAGARRAKACEVIGQPIRTLQRWRAVGEDVVVADQRPTAKRPPVAHRLSDEERARIVCVSNQAEYAHLPPSQIVPKLADQGEYIASESSFCRVLKAHQQVNVIPPL